MKPQIIQSHIKNFEDYVNKTEGGVEFWFARDLQKLLGYSEWRNFNFVIEKAKISCDNNNQNCQEHFADINKTIPVPNGGEKSIVDIILTRYACYLIAQNGDSKKEEIAFAQSYFAIQTRKAELIQERIEEIERLKARKKLTESEKELSQVIFQQTKGNDNFAKIRNKGDTAFFGGKSTNEMKIVWKIKNKPLADFMPTILLKAKDLANEITVYNAKDKRMNTEYGISEEHVKNNKAVRQTLISRGITPEKVAPKEDIKKVERKIKSEEKKVVKNISISKKSKK